MKRTKTLSNGNDLFCSIETEVIDGKRYAVTYWLEIADGDVVRKWRPTRREMLTGVPA